MSKLPDDLKWSEEVLALLAETDKTSCKSVCIALGKAAEKGRLFGLPKVRGPGAKGGYERTTSQQWSLESLKSLQKSKATKL